LDAPLQPPGPTAARPLANEFASFSELCRLPAAPASPNRLQHYKVELPAYQIDHLSFASATTIGESIDKFCTGMKTEAQRTRDCICDSLIDRDSLVRCGAIG
jgi:hypothetical protein